jgi:hypothetical protein
MHESTFPLSANLSLENPPRERPAQTIDSGVELLPLGVEEKQGIYTA